MSSTFELNNNIKANQRLLGKLKCLIEAQVANAIPGGGCPPVAPIINCSTEKCCDTDCNIVFKTICQTTPVTVITVPGGPGEPVNGIKNTPCCGASIPFTTPSGQSFTCEYEIGDTVETMTCKYADGTEYLGDPNTLDPTCSCKGSLDCQPISCEQLCLTNSQNSLITVGGTSEEFLSGINGAVNSEDFSAVTPGSYTSVTTPSGEFFHYDYSVSGLFAGTQRTITVEQPLSQNGASVAGTGVETIGGGTTSYNSIIHCLSSPIGFWGADILDAESTSAFGEARIITYDSSFNVISDNIFPGGEDIVQFGGVIDPNNSISYVQVVVGDQNGGSLQDQLAYTNIVYGTIDELLTNEVYSQVKCLTESGIVFNTYGPDGVLVTDQTIIDSLESCENNPIPVLDYEYVRIPVCDTDNNQTVFQQFLYINDDLQTPTMWFNELGDEISEPVNYQLGYCEDPNVEFEESPICINGEIQGVRRVYVNPLTQIVTAIEFEDNTGTLIPPPENWEFGKCPFCETVTSQGTLTSWDQIRN